MRWRDSTIRKCVPDVQCGGRSTAHHIIDTIREREDWDDRPDSVLLKQLKVKGKMRCRRGVMREHGTNVQVATSATAEEQHEAAEDIGVKQLLTNFGTLA